MAETKERFGKIIKEVLVGVLVTLIVTMLLAALAFVTDSSDFLVSNWRIFLLVLVTALLIVLTVLYLKKLNQIDTKVKQLESKVDGDLSRNASLVDQEARSTLKKLTAKVGQIEHGLYDIRRDYLYKKAKEHEKLEQRGALLCRLEVIRLDVEKEYDFNLDESLRELHSYIRKQEIVSTQDLSDIKNTLSKITKNEGHKEIVENILAVAKSKLE